MFLPLDNNPWNLSEGPIRLEVAPGVPLAPCTGRRREATTQELHGNARPAADGSSGK